MYKTNVPNIKVKRISRLPCRMDLIGTCKFHALLDERIRQEPVVYAQFLYRHTETLVYPVTWPFFLLTISSPGSPPIDRNSIPWCSTHSLYSACVAIRHRCPSFCSSLASAMYGCTSPREPIVRHVICIGWLGGTGWGASTVGTVDSNGGPPENTAHELGLLELDEDALSTLTVLGRWQDVLFS